jgi:serine/threonine-protein kinase
MILDGTLVKITDFGVARSKGSDLTQHDEIIGSVSYIAPEIWLGKELTLSADLYSMGIILYEMITGGLPFEDDEPATMMWYHVKHPPAPPKQSRSSCPNWLNQLALKLMSKAPSDRPKSAGEISALIEKRRRAGSIRPGDSIGGTVINAPAVSGGTASGKTSGSVRMRKSRGNSRTGAYPSHRRPPQAAFGKLFFFMCFISASGVLGTAFYVSSYVKSLLLL